MNTRREDDDETRADEARARADDEQMRAEHAFDMRVLDVIDERPTSTAVIAKRLIDRGMDTTSVPRGGLLASLERLQRERRVVLSYVDDVAHARLPRGGDES